MLTISEAFKLYIPEKTKEFIDEKLKEFEITCLSSKFFDGAKYLPENLKGKAKTSVPRCCMECYGDPENVNKLAAYLRNDFNFHASIHYGR